MYWIVPCGIVCRAGVQRRILVDRRPVKYSTLLHNNDALNKDGVNGKPER